MQLRRMTVLCMALLISCVLIGCNSTPKESGRYYNKGKGFSIKFPEGWKKQKSPRGVIITFGSPEDTASVGVQKQKVSPQQTLAYTVKFMKSYTRKIGGKIIDTGETVIDNVDASWLLSDLGSETIITYYMKKDDYIYSILASAAKDDFYEDEMRSIARSFRFE
ncbi:MAG: PsbP-related protein [Nitrospirota bacterium]|nr:PsbP-related protein [Nitrospirota bacterium]